MTTVGYIYDIHIFNIYYFQSRPYIYIYLTITLLFADHQKRILKEGQAKKYLSLSSQKRKHGYS